MNDDSKPFVESTAASPEEESTVLHEFRLTSWEAVALFRVLDISRDVRAMKARMGVLCDCPRCNALHKCEEAVLSRVLDLPCPRHLPPDRATIEEARAARDAGRLS